MQTPVIGRWVNPQMVVWARKQVGLNPQQASEHVAQKVKKAKGVARTAFSAEDLLAWETGAKDPHIEHLELLAEIYECPAGYFFLDTPPQQTTPRLDFRGLAPNKAERLTYETYQSLRRFQRLAEYAERLARELELAFPVQIAPASVATDVQAVVRRSLESLEVTQQLRASWTTDAKAFESWRLAIERQGILVFSLKLDPRDVRGASVAPGTGPPAILVNHADVEAATGRTFTLVHEYAHLVVKHSGLVCDFRGQRESSDIETFCNRFAAEAIVPRGRFRSLLRDKNLDRYRESWSDALLDKLREPFRASRDVVTILLQDLELAPPEFYRRRREVWEKRRPFGRGGRGGGQSLASRRLRELGSAFSKLLVKAERSGIISRLDVADLLDTNIQQADTFMALSQGV
ncbi:MAG: ImmA/IrrE family metallo-endopeptidase [Chloroflexi bacterium]|nr:ImmA/IrrE family metallo-endopeptidase [Chloroflexota bacterium]